jgi:putative addiction module killer protein
MEAAEREVRIYRLPDGRTPFLKWLNDLRDRQARQRIQVRIARLRLGNFGQTRSLGEGVHELKVDYGPGYRIYFGRDGEALVILLSGGDKTTQNEDIKEAKQYWARYRQEQINADR